MNKNLRKGLRTWIEIDKKAIKHNFNVFRKLVDKDCKILSVVKSNAYGHNFIEFAQEQEKLNTDFLGVDSMQEALALRREGLKKPILVLGYTVPERINEAAKKNISITISNFEFLSAVIKSGVKIKVHIKVDTGMNRHGFLENDIKKVLKILKESGNIIVEGLYTHLSTAKDPKLTTYTNSQIEKFNKWRDAFINAGYSPICHASATGGALLFKNANFDMIRVGIGLYGIWPSKESYLYLKNKISLKPVLSWRTIVAEVKKIPKGSKVGYDGTNIVKKDTILAVVPIGYWHGYPRALSNLGYFLVNGKKANILGRVCMDIIMIDVTYAGKIKVGDEVTIIGKPARTTIQSGGSKNAEITADEISKLLNGSTYELLTRINPLIKRFYI